MTATDERVQAALEAILSDARQQLRAELEQLVRSVRDDLAEEQAEAARAAHSAAEAAANAFAAEAIAAERQSAELRVREAVAAAREMATEEQAAALAALRTELELARDEAVAAASAAADRQQRAVAAAHATEREADLAVVSSLVEALRTLDEAPTLSAVLDAVALHAARHVGRVALFVVRDGRLQMWKAHGFDDPAVSALELAPEDGGFVQEAIASAAPCTASGPAEGPVAPLGADRAAVAIPLLVDGRAVGVLYADDDRVGERVVPSAWPEGIEAIVRHASRCLEALTARRMPELIRASRTERARAQTLQQDDEAAQRYARLLVAEIKLYHEPAVDEGRRHGDLLRRLRPQIERAHRLYDERVTPAIRARTAYFEDELVRTLAGGDPALLGQPS
jgi:hypothetical protein